MKQMWCFQNLWQFGGKKLLRQNWVDSITIDNYIFEPAVTQRPFSYNLSLHVVYFNPFFVTKI